MSMSQEEIEALMNGLDISEDENEPEEETLEKTGVNTEEIEQLLSQTEDIKVEEESEKKAEEVKKVEAGVEPEESFEDLTVDNDSIDDLINEVSSENTSLVNNDEIDDLLKDIEGVTDDSIESDENVSLDNDSIEELLNSVEEESPLEPKVEVKEEPKVEKTIDEDEIGHSWTTNKINEGIFPLPAEQDTKVVSQLSQVANDSEEKVGQIFDVLSFSLDNNNNVRNEIKNIQSFLDEEKKLLENLSTKFPNISIFSKHLAEISKINDNITQINNNSFEEDNKIFEAMELMQFNDINRQKIERVMAVIRKLSLYLNNLFEDDGSSAEVAVAKHIHGDNTEDLIGEDLDKLIEEFSNKE